MQANVPGSQRPYEQYSFLPFKTWSVSLLGFIWGLSWGGPGCGRCGIHAGRLAHVFISFFCLAIAFNHPQGYSFDNNAPTYTYYYTLPYGLTCDGVTARCVMQW